MVDNFGDELTPSQQFDDAEPDEDTCDFCGHHVDECVCDPDGDGPELL